MTSAVLLDVSSILLQNHDLSAFKSVVFNSIYDHRNWQSEFEKSQMVVILLSTHYHLFA